MQPKKLSGRYGPRGSYKKRKGKQAEKEATASADKMAFQNAIMN
jgi:hypothetical protein